MTKEPLTVGEMIEALQEQPEDAVLAWTDDEGRTGYFYEHQQQMSLDDGHVHVACGPALDVKE